MKPPARVTIGESSKLDARALGQLLLMQSVVGSLPTDEAMRDFVCRGLADLPGVREVEWRDAPAAPGGEPARRFPVAAGHARQGELVFRLDDPAAFEPYAAYCGNSCFMLAVILEERRVRQLLQQHQAELEKAVEARTSELNRQMAERERMLQEAARVRRALLSTLEDQKRAEATLRQSEARFQFAMEASRDGLWDWNVVTNEVYYSPGYTAMLGYSAGELAGDLSSWMDLLHPEDREAAVAANFGCVERRCEDFEIEFRMRARNGEWRWILGRGKAVSRDAGGRATRVVGTHTDITVRRGLEEQLRQSQKMEAVGQLAGGVAHDFNNILTAILMSSGFLKDNPTLDAAAREAVAEVEANAQRAADLTRQLLLFGRRSVMRAGVLDLNDVLVDLQKMLRRLLGEHIVFEVAGETGLPRIHADRGMIEQVVVNLCVNARDAMPEGGCLSVRTASANVQASAVKPLAGTRPGRFVCLSVSDTGIGMDEATRQRIFEPFFTTKEVGKGTGLGLATVHGIVQQHRGWVAVESALGRGTTFRVFLPALAPDVATLPAPALSERSPGGDETILLVEDEQTVRSVVARSLRQRGYRVVEAANGAEALQLWRQHRDTIDLLYTDAVMPGGLSGVELAVQLRADRPGLSIIVSSGYSAELHGQDSSPIRGAMFVPKPCAPEDLAAAVRACLDRPGSGPSTERLPRAE